MRIEDLKKFIEEAEALGSKIIHFELCLEQLEEGEKVSLSLRATKKGIELLAEEDVAEEIFPY